MDALVKIFFQIYLTVKDDKKIQDIQKLFTNEINYERID